MSDFINPIVTILTAIIGVALLAVLVSRNANTAGVIKSGSQGFSQMLGTAMGPVSGGMGNFGGNYFNGF